MAQSRPDSPTKFPDSIRSTLPFPALPAHHPANSQFSEVVVDPQDDDDTSSAGQEEGLMMQIKSRESFSTENDDLEVGRLRKVLRARGTSIKFDGVVQADDGHIHSLDKPLPKSSQSALERGLDDDATHPYAIPIRQRLRRRSETGKEEFDARTGHSLRDAQDLSFDLRKSRYHQGESRYPLVQSTVDELASEPLYGELGTVETFLHTKPNRTASSSANDDKQPLSISTLLESETSSPVAIEHRQSQSAVLPARRSASQRSFGSLGSVGRRHQIRSNTSSLTSPARSYLSQWTRGEEAVKEPDPDEQGQEIGDGSGYIIGRQIGHGGFSIIKEVTSIENDKRMTRAVKIVRKQIKDKSDPENEALQTEFEREVGVWRYAKHAYILPLIAVYDTSFATFCITKLNEGGTLFDLIRARRKAATGPTDYKGLSAKLAKRYLYQLGSAIRFLHEDMRVVHRDIKPENCLLDMSGPQADIQGGNVLLCDFGMADFIHNEHRETAVSDLSNSRDELLNHRQNGNIVNVGPSLTSTNIQGSLEYTAPELCSMSQPIYSTAADMWAFGCVAYTLLVGDRPFYHEFQPRLVLMIEKGAYDVDRLRASLAVMEDGNEFAVDFVNGCLTLDPAQRFSISKALEHEFLAGCRELYEPLERFD